VAVPGEGTTRKSVFQVLIERGIKGGNDTNWGGGPGTTIPSWGVFLKWNQEYRAMVKRQSKRKGAESLGRPIAGREEKGQKVRIQ